MNFYRINWIIPLNNLEYINDIREFVTKIIGHKTHYFLYLKLEIKYDHIYITGYSLQSLSDIDDDRIWVYLYNGINVFILRFEALNDINESKNTLYINCFGRFMSTYH
jgi:hypothetical protein